MAKREVTAKIEAGGGLPIEFLQAVAERLRALGIPATVDSPAVLVFRAKDRAWVTGETGLHVNDYEGCGENLPGDGSLRALETEEAITLDLYVDVLVGLIRYEL